MQVRRVADPDVVAARARQLQRDRALGERLRPAGRPGPVTIGLGDGTENTAACGVMWITLQARAAAREQRDLVPGAVVGVRRR